MNHFDLIIECETNNKNIDFSNGFLPFFNQIYEKNYSYGSKVTGYTTNRIANENIIINNSTLSRSYTYNDNGLLTEISSNNEFSGAHYGYDQKGRISQDYTNNKSYTYDSNGNIKTKGNISYEYTSSIAKDILTKYNGISINYYQTDPYLVSSYNQMSFTYEARKLKSVTKSGVTTVYNYDMNGLRTSKTGVTYYYSNNKLQTEIGNNYRIDFIYEDELIGFILTQGNNINTYYYLIDSYKNIIGI